MSSCRRMQSRRQARSDSQRLLRHGAAADRWFRQAHHQRRRCRLKTIEVIVTPDGTTRVETRGFAGSSCQDASRFLEQSLGTKHDERMTTEYYQALVNRAQQATEQA